MTQSKRDAAAEKMYPCADCGALRTKAQGGTTFTVCDDCWDKRHPTKPGEIEAANDTFKSGYDQGRTQAIEEVLTILMAEERARWTQKSYSSLVDLMDKIKSLKEK